MKKRKKDRADAVQRIMDTPPSFTDPQGSWTGLPADEGGACGNVHSFAVFVPRTAKRARAAGRCADWAAGFSAPPPAGMVFCRKQRKKLQKKAPLPGADSPYQGEMSRRDKRGRDAGSAQPRLRGCCRFAIKPKPQVWLAVWKGRNGLRGKEAPRTAGTRSVEAGSDAPPAALSFLSQEKR